MTLRLTVLAGELKGQAFLLDGDAVTIGRGPGVDLEIKDNSISKQHARVEVDGIPWPAHVEDEEIIPGTTVEITDAIGTTLKIRNTNQG